MDDFFSSARKFFFKNKKEKEMKSKKERLFNLVDAFSEVADDPKKFRNDFEKLFQNRVEARRAKREAVREDYKDKVKVLILDGNEIHIIQNRDNTVWVASHINLGTFAEGDSVSKALGNLFEVSEEYIRYLWSFKKEGLAAEESAAYDFVAKYSSLEVWAGRLRAEIVELIK